MIKRNVIDLDQIFNSRKNNFLGIIMDGFMEKLLPMYIIGKSNGKISDFGGKKLIDCWYYLCKFLDSLGILFFDKHERILEEGKNYGIEQLMKRMTQWREKRRVDAIIGLVEFSNELKTEKEYERKTEDLTGIKATVWQAIPQLNMLTQKINIAVESIKRNIPNAEAIESSADNFKKFVSDIIEKMKSIVAVSTDEEQKSEISQILNSLLQTITLFTENVDITINQIINRVKESVDLGIAEPEEIQHNFDKFLQDLRDILESVNSYLRKLSMPKN